MAKLCDSHNMKLIEPVRDLETAVKMIDEMKAEIEVESPKLF